MAKKQPTGEQNLREELTAPNDVPALTDEVITLRLKQNAYWKGEFCREGTTFEYARAEALKILATTELFVAVDKQS